MDEIGLSILKLMAVCDTSIARLLCELKIKKDKCNDGIMAVVLNNAELDNLGHA